MSALATLWSPLVLSFGPCLTVSPFLALKTSLAFRLYTLRTPPSVWPIRLHKGRFPEGHALLLLTALLHMYSSPCLEAPSRQFVRRTFACKPCSRGSRSWASLHLHSSLFACPSLAGFFLIIPWNSQIKNQNRSRSSRWAEHTGEGLVAKYLPQ
jgi:hypothetical protein